MFSNEPVKKEPAQEGEKYPPECMFCHYDLRGHKVVAVRIRNNPNETFICERCDNWMKSMKSAFPDIFEGISYAS